MSESLEALRNEMFETMQRMRQRRSTLPLPPGITRGEINALMMLSMMEARDEIARPGMLAACSHATPGAVSQTLKSLEEKGLIVRRRGEGDSRSVTISLTDAGHEFEKEGRRLHDERFMHMLEFLGEDDAREFVRIVNRMLEFEESHPWEGCRRQQRPLLRKGRRRAMRLIKNFANYKIAVAIVVVLLAVQAFCDLSLPNYTSDIVDVGIQQSGVEHASTDALTERTHDLVAIMESEQNESLFADSYFQRSDGTYELTDFGREHRAELDDAMSMPLVAVHYADQTGMDLDQLKTAYDAGMVQKSDVQTMLDEAKSQMGDMADSIVSQQAIAAAKAEYEQLGYDLNTMQMNYLLITGGKMLGLAALGMVIAVIVGFIASRTAAKIGASLRSRLFERVLSFSDAEIQSFSAASLITRGTNDVQQVQMVSVMMLRMILYAPILAIGGIIMIARTNLSMGWIIVAAVLAIAVVMLFLMKVAMPKFKIMQKLIDRVNLVSA